MNSIKNFFRRNWLVLTPIIIGIIINEGQIIFLIELLSAGNPLGEASRALIPNGSILLRIQPYLGLSLVLHLLSKKIPLKFLLPVLILGIISIIATWLPFIYNYHIVFYGTDVPTDGMVGLIFIALLLAYIPILSEGIVLGLIVSLGIAINMDLRTRSGIYYIKPSRRLSYLIPAAILLGFFVLVVFPWNLKQLNNQRYTFLLSNEIVEQTKLETIFRKSVKYHDKYLLYSIASRQKCPEEMVSELFEIGKDYEDRSRIMQGIVRNENTPEAFYYKIYDFCHTGSGFKESYKEEILRSIARSSHSPTDLVINLVNSPSERIRSGAALNRSLQIELLEGLARDSSFEVSENAARSLKLRDKK